MRSHGRETNDVPETGLVEAIRERLPTRGHAVQPPAARARRRVSSSGSGTGRGRQAGAAYRERMDARGRGRVRPAHHHLGPVDEHW